MREVTFILDVSFMVEVQVCKSAYASVLQFWVKPCDARFSLSILLTVRNGQFVLLNKVRSFSVDKKNQQLIPYCLDSVRSVWQCSATLVYVTDEPISQCNTTTNLGLHPHGPSWCALSPLGHRSPFIVALRSFSCRSLCSKDHGHWHIRRTDV